MNTYGVLVGNVGWVLLNETNAKQARFTFERYRHMSQENTESRAYGESVSLWEGDEPLEVHEGWMSKEEEEEEEEDTSYSLLVGNIGWVLQNVTEETARNGYAYYVKVASTDKGHRAYGRSVTLMRNAEIIAEYQEASHEIS